jgi:Aminotransferase class-III
LVETGTFPGPEENLLPSANSYQVLAAKNATLRLRAPSGHVFSFTDLTCAAGAVNFGHLNPAIDPFPMLASDVAADFYPPSADAFSHWLRRKLQLKFHSVHYEVGSGVAAAIAMGQRRRLGKILVVEGSTHAGMRALDGRVRSITPGSECSDWNDLSCLIYEPIQAASGYVPLALPWLRGLSQQAQAAGVLVIADETQCGFYRFGKLSLAANGFLRPDVFLLGNSMTNGIYPLAAIVCAEAFAADMAQIAADGSSVFQASTLGFQAAEAVASYIDSTDIEGQVAQIYGVLSKVGERLAANPGLSDFHLGGPTLSFEVRDRRAEELAVACRARGVLMAASADRRRVMIAPPLTISMDQLNTAMGVLEQATGMLQMHGKSA